MLGIILLSGCALTPKKPIAELYDPVYSCKYQFTPAQKQDKPVGYTIGIIDMNLTSQSVPPKSFGIITDLEKQYVNEFTKAFSAGLEKIFMSKGMTVSGPFESYEDMTYPERSRCDFLVQPEVNLTFYPTPGTLEKLPSYGGPNGEYWTMAQLPFSVKATAELKYVILDPLTQEKLERHSLKTDNVKHDFSVLYCHYVTKNKKGETVKEEWKDIWHDKKAFPGYHNVEVVVGKITDDLFSVFMPKIDRLVSVEEFDHLKKYKEELKQKKRY